jgi:hypothetical protein
MARIEAHRNANDGPRRADDRTLVQVRSGANSQYVPERRLQRRLQSVFAVPAPALSRDSILPAGECPSEDDILALVSGRPTARARAALAEHLEACAGCRLLVGEAARVLAPAAAPFSPATTFAPGSRLGDRYEIVKRVGAGGMGEVYAAKDLLLNDVVACKTLACSTLDDARAGQRLKAEVLLARRVSHRNVCRILEYGVQHDGDGTPAARETPFFTMELLEGRTLSSRLAQDGPCKLEEAERFARQLLDGLEAIHAQGIVHRDLKLDNIFVVDEKVAPRLVITDFGLACAVDLSRSLAGYGGKIIGTLDYMAPEQVLGAPATTAFDIYALGVVLFELVTGRRPTSRENPIAGAVARVTGPAPLLSSVAPGADRTWERVIARCLSREPRERYAGVAEIRAELFAPSSMRHSARRRLRALAAPLAAVGLLGVALVVAAGRPQVPATAARAAAPSAATTPASGGEQPRPAPAPDRVPTPSFAPQIRAAGLLEAAGNRGTTTTRLLPAPRPARRRPPPRAPSMSPPAATTAEPAKANSEPSRNGIYAPTFSTRPPQPSVSANGLPTLTPTP